MADPVSAVIAVVSVFSSSAGAAAAAWAAAAPLTVAALNVAAGLAVSSLLTPKVPGYADAGAQLEFQADPNAGIPIVFGRTCVAGSLALQYPSGPKNKHLNMIGVYSGCGPIGGVDAVEMSDAPFTYNNATGKVLTGKFKDRMWYKTALGNPVSPALTQPAEPATDSPLPQWSAAHKMSGFAQFWLDCEYDGEVWTTAIEPRVVIRGVATYDPRQDDTYPGGAGPMRADDCLTWAYSNCPIRAALSYYLGYHYTVDGKRRRMGGVGIPSSGIDMASFVEAMNVSDANGWTIGCRITTLDAKWDTGKRLLKTASAEPVAQSGMLGVRIDAPRTSLATVTGDDLAAPFSVPATKTRRDRVNAIIPRYRSEDHKWEIVPGGVVEVASYQALDGGLRQKEIEYSFCQDARQAGQLAAYDLVNAREFGPISIQCKPWLVGYRPGDAITLNIPEAGLNNQLVIIKRRQFDPMGATVTLTVESETTAKHAFALGRTDQPPPTPGLTTPDFATIPAPQAGQWTAALGTDTGGLPSITVTGSASDNAFATQVVFEWRTDSAAPWRQAGTCPASQTSFVISGLGGGVTYEVAVSYVTIYAGPGARLILDPLATNPAVIDRATDTDNVAGRPSTQVIEDIDLNAQTLLGYLMDVQDLRDYVDGLIYVDGQPVNAVVAEQITEVMNEVQALAQKLALTGVAFNNGSAWVLRGDIAIGDETKVLSQQLTQLRASIDDNYAEITENLGVVVSPAGGAVATAVQLLDVNGHVVGQKATNNGVTGKIRFNYDSFEMYTPDGDLIFVADDDGVTMPHVTVTGKLKVDTIEPVQTGYESIKLLSQAQAFGNIEYVNDTNGNYCAPFTGYPSGRERFVQMCELGNSASLDPAKRIRNGTRTFVVSGSASVDAYCSVWYQVYNPATSSWGAPVYVARGVDNASGVGNVTVPGGVDITIPPNGSVRFYLSVNRGGLGSDAWDAATGNRSMENLNLLVTSVNF